mgnify:CR=1 FL=1
MSMQSEMTPIRPGDPARPEAYIRKALSLGAADALAFHPEDLAFDPRTLLKCMFGCPDWGLGPTCPSRPGSLRPWEYRDILVRYRWGILVHARDKKTSHEVSFALERQAFLDGYPFAFSLSDCAACETCAGLQGHRCANPRKARPAFHSVGIDVFATVHRFGLPLEPLQSETDPQNWYSAVFIE